MRGRRVCWELLTRTGGWVFEDPGQAAGPARFAQALTAAVARSDIGALAIARKATSFVAALADAVAWARYWQEPDDRDLRLADAQVTDALSPVAEAISRAPAARWWSTPIDLAAQQEVVFDDPDGRSSVDPPRDGRAALVAWRDSTVHDEQAAADRPRDLGANLTGRWWSTPALSWLARSTRTLGTAGPVGLHLVEDELGWTSARCWTLRAPPAPRVYEIANERDWGELVARNPLSVTNARRHDWWRATSQDHAWTIPDYLAVAADYDAIHLTVTAYLSTAGRAIGAGNAHTVLAGWDPDQTWWLTRAPERDGPPRRWTRTPDPEPFAWHTTT